MQGTFSADALAEALMELIHNLTAPMDRLPIAHSAATWSPHCSLLCPARARHLQRLCQGVSALLDGLPGAVRHGRQVEEAMDLPCEQRHMHMSAQVGPTTMPEDLGRKARAGSMCVLSDQQRNVNGITCRLALCKHAHCLPAGMPNQHGACLSTFAPYHAAGWV